VETHVENVAVRLAARGHRVTVYCRSRYRASGSGGVERGTDGARMYRGVRLVYVPSIHTKHLDTPTHAAWCALHCALTRRAQIVHFHGIGPAAFAGIPRLSGIPVVSTFHALDWRQEKWGKWAVAFLRRGERIAARRSDALVVVSKIMQAYVADTYGQRAEWIPNGASVPPVRGTGSLARWGLTANEYVLAVGRIIRDRQIDTLIRAFTGMPGKRKLCVVGSETPRTVYTDYLKSLANDRVVFTGDVFGTDLETIYASARVYVLASRVEGLPITVCEAMAHGRALLLSDIPENHEVAGDAALYFSCGDEKDLRRGLERMCADDKLRETLGGVARERSRTVFHWDRVTDTLESLYYRVVAGKGRNS